MYPSNPWFWLALLATVGLYKLELFAILLNLKSLVPTVPDKFKEWMNQEQLERAQEYARVNARLEVIESSVSVGVFITFWWAGGFHAMDQWIQSWGQNALITGLAIFAIFALAQSLLSLPFEIYHTFFVEAEFGFNRTTVHTFILDRMKGLLLLTALGAPLLATILWLFDHVPLAALYGWLILTGFSLLMTFLSPRLLLPMFFKFQPLPDEQLKSEIVSMSERLQFPVGDVSLVDGSRRSAKANAFFTGMGRLKRIAIFDTLVENHSREEILAVLAHEIGHSKRKHVPRQIALSLATSALMFALLHFAVHDPRLTTAFGVTPPTVAWSLLFFGILYRPISTVLGWLTSWLSRKYEFEADAYAREAMGGPASLSSALTRMSRDHLSNPTPHPFYVFLHYSHPPVLQRLEALEGKTAS